MKRYLTIILTLTSTLLFGQEKSFEPSRIYEFPDIHPDTVSSIEKRSRDYHEIIDNDIPSDQLTPYQKKLLEDEMLLSEGPFFTGPWGCSWYCATGPKNISTTSELDSSEVANYKPTNIHDFDLRTAWVEGKEGYGIGEEIEFEFELGQNSSLKLTDLVIYNGYAKSLTTWQANSRVKTMEVFINGQRLGILELKDTYFGQVFEIGSFDGGSNGKLLLTLKIVDIYEGDKFSDTAISEINFDGTGDH